MRTEEELVSEIKDFISNNKYLNRNMIAKACKVDRKKLLMLASKYGIPLPAPLSKSGAAKLARFSGTRVNITITGSNNGAR